MINYIYVHSHALMLYCDLVIAMNIHSLFFRDGITHRE